MVEIILLAVQFIIGMWMNLFATFPTLNSSFPMLEIMDVMIWVPELMIHMMVGMVVGLLSLVIFMMTIMKGNYKMIMISTIGSVSILFAGISGLDFMFSDFQNNISSFIMSVGFIFAIISYFILIYYPLVSEL
jgi:hypothetical protein